MGLGNPGLSFKDSRHNIGFSVIRSLAKDYKAALKKDNNSFSLTSKIKVDGQTVILAMPLTFMNLSGIAVQALLKKHKLDLENLLVICDDLDLELGRQRIRAAGSSGGQKGLKSIIDSLESADFARLRIGIGRPSRNTQASDYVLSRFDKQQKVKVNGIIETAKECCLTWATKGMSETMNTFNSVTPQS